MTTIHDVASLSGFLLHGISCSSGKGSVKKETMDAILKAAEVLHYTLMCSLRIEEGLTVLLA
jgi:DNA-binding LacI/PurR family transcriptional regulator